MLQKRKSGSWDGERGEQDVGPTEVQSWRKSRVGQGKSLFICLHKQALLYWLGLGGATAEKKKGPPSPRAGTGLGNIETVHEPKPIQTGDAHWGQGRRAMADLTGPCTQYVKGHTPSR
jgi:hypothetical protein